MRHLKLAAVSVAVAAALAVLTVSAAAAAPRLAILEPTTTALAPNGYPNVASVFFFTTHSPEVFCSETAEGTLLNDRSSDRDALSGPFNDGCAEVDSGNLVPPSEYSLVGGFKRFTLSWTGFAEITGGTATLSEPGRCVYDFHSLHGSLRGSEPFAFGQTLAEGQAEGSLDRPVSSITCPQAQTLHFMAQLTNVDETVLLNAEVRG